MTTLREAAQQALEALEATHYDVGSAEKQRLQTMDAITALRDALAQQEQEPVAWGLRNDEGEIFDCIPPVPHSELSEYDVPLYTAPPRREWQGLSEEDMEDLLPLYSDPSADAEMLEFAAAIEVKLKEKNA